MEPDANRHRRAATILMLCMIYIVTMGMQCLIVSYLEHPSSFKFINTIKNMAISKPVSITTSSINEGTKSKAQEGNKGDIASVDYPTYDEDLEPRLTKIYLELQSCLPRFICEVHAQPPGNGMFTDLEKNILSMFKGHVFLEGPSSPVYSYQIAAHMGQLSSGIIPSPCHSMYPNCPLSRQRLLDLLSGIRASKSLLL